MAFGFELAKHRLSRALSEPIQAQLQSLCLPGGPDVFVDRIDVILDGATFTPVFGAGNALVVAMPVDVFFVSMQDLLAFPNQDLPYLPTPSDRIIVKVKLTATGTTLSATAEPPDLNATRLPTQLRETLAEMLAQVINTRLSNNAFDAAPMLAQYGMPVPTSVRISMTPAAILIEYDPTGPTITRTGAGQEWGMFIDAASALAFGLSKLPSELRSGLVSTSAAWAPIGTTPRILANTKLSLGVFDFNLPLDIRMSVVPGAPALLRVDFSWDIEVNAVTVMDVPLSVILNWAGLPGLGAVVSEIFAEALELGLDGIAALADEFLKQALAEQGVQPLGGRSYRIDRPLPPLAMFGVELRVQSLLAIASGMTLGGLVMVDKLPRTALSMGTNPFGAPFFPTTCRKDGPKKPKVKKHLIRYLAGVHLYDAGRFCSAQLLDPVHPAAELIEPSLTATDATTDGFGFDLSVDDANTLTTDIRLLVLTSRGTRMVNFGRPIPAIVDSEGNVINVVGHLDEDCQTYNPNDPWAKVMFGDDPVKLTQEELDPPLEDPGWLALVTGGYGVDVHLVTLEGLEPGEQVVFESASHRIQVSADAQGRVVVPGIAPRGADMPSARLSRLSQRALEKEPRIESLALDAGALFAAQEPLRDAAGHLLPDRGERFAAPMRHFSLGSLRFIASRSDSASLWKPAALNALNPQPLPPEPPPEGSLNPQPLPPEPPDEHPLVRSAGLTGVIAVYALPGMGGERIGIAAMADGRMLVLEAGEDRARVSGTFEGPIGRTITKDGFAIAAGAGHVRLFSVH